MDPDVPHANLLADLLRSLRSNFQISLAADIAQALAIADRITPELIFVEARAPALDGVKFTRDLRRSARLYKAAPIVMMSNMATASLIFEARDVGVHEFLRRPYTLGDLLKRINAVSGPGREWIEAKHYVGPDRRRFNSAAQPALPDRRAEPGE